MKQRPLQTQVTKWSLFFSYFNFYEQGGPKGQASPSARTLEGLLPGGHTARDPRCVASSPGSGRKCPWCGQWGVGYRRACTSGRGARRSRWHEKYYLFFGFVKGRWDYGMGLEEPALRWLPQVERGPAQLPRPFAPSPGGRLPLPGSERWPWRPRRGEQPCALPATIAIPEPHSVFPCLGARAQREHASGGCYHRVLPSIHPTPQGLSLVPCPRDSGPFLTKEPAHVGA